VVADANPTKEFFAEVLGKDITLVAAIIDLVDNSVDGARRLRGSGSFAGLKIDIEARADRFSIHDNCGGIAVPLAAEYAFRFGRPGNKKPPEFSTGQFGVGMKRALFKLGDHFHVTSATQTSSFELDVDVPEWLAESGKDWTFELKNVREGIRVADTKVGTAIKVDRLHPTISQDLGNLQTLSQLRLELRHRHLLSLSKGLVIRVNGDAVRAEAPTLIETPQIKPAYRRFQLNGDGPLVDVRLLCGVSNGPAREGGWSVFLNSRMVLVNDQSGITGWGTKDARRIPQFHGQYGKFRGYAFMDCKTTTRLPWDTTKTGLDVDSPRYREMAAGMVELMEPVVRFLDEVDRENTDARKTGREGPLLKALAVKERPLFDVLKTAPRGRRAEREFSRPPAKPRQPEPAKQSIQFSRPKEEVERMKEYFGVTSAGAAGEQAWEYILEVEEL